MLLEIFAIIMIAAGLLGILLAFESKDKDNAVARVLIVSFLLIAIGSWVVISSIGFYILLRKAIGVLIALAGGFLTFKFQGSYAQEGFFQKIAAFIGLVFLLMGAYLAMF